MRYLRVEERAAEFVVYNHHINVGHCLHSRPVHGEFVNSRTNASARVGLVRYRHSASVRIHDSPAHTRGTPVDHHRQTRAPGRDTCGRGRILVAKAPVAHQYSRTAPRTESEFGRSPPPGSWIAVRVTKPRGHAPAAPGHTAGGAHGTTRGRAILSVAPRPAEGALQLPRPRQSRTAAGPARFEASLGRA